MIRVGVVGATGYTGIELVRLLLQHPGVTIDVVTSRGEAGRRLDNLFPSLLGVSDLCFTDPADARLRRLRRGVFCHPPQRRDARSAGADQAGDSGGGSIGRFQTDRCGFVGALVWRVPCGT